MFDNYYLIIANRGHFLYLNAGFRDYTAVKQLLYRYGYTSRNHDVKLHRILKKEIPKGADIKNIIQILQYFESIYYVRGEDANNN